jgi:hypothetical protein
MFSQTKSEKTTQLKAKNTKSKLLISWRIYQKPLILMND